MKLYELPRSEEGIKIFGLKGQEGEELVIRFFHVDGMYSYCMAETLQGMELGPVHLSASTPIKKVKGGYEIEEDNDSV